MSIFNLKLKTKAGNDIKKRETFTVFFRIKYITGIKITAEYVYHISYSKGYMESKAVSELRTSQDVKSIEDLTLKVMLNLCHMVGKLTQTNNINPDFILFISPDLNPKSNHAWEFLSSAFKRPNFKNVDEKIHFAADPMKWIKNHQQIYDMEWKKKDCDKFKIKKEELDMIKYFADTNPNTVFMTIDPNRDSKKYAKSLQICDKLQDRLDRITTNDIQPF